MRIYSGNLKFVDSKCTKFLIVLLTNIQICHTSLFMLCFGTYRVVCLEHYMLGFGTYRVVFPEHYK